MQNLVGDALELGRSREGKINPRRFKISDFVIQTLTEVFDLVQSSTSEEMKTCSGLTELRDTLEKEGLILSVEADKWNRQVFIDEAKIKQILRNLLNNALKYRKSRVDLQINIEDEYLAISVSDDGEGIPAIYHQKIFECYFQLPIGDTCSVRGHGLGLAGVMVLLEDMGGELILESDRGSGATFRVKIPLMEV
jgi:two-component system, OmpR family, sensor kinase